MIGLLFGLFLGPTQAFAELSLSQGQSGLPADGPDGQGHQGKLPLLAISILADDAAASYILLAIAADAQLVKFRLQAGQIRLPAFV